MIYDDPVAGAISKPATRQLLDEYREEIIMEYRGAYRPREMAKIEQQIIDLIEK